MPNSLYFSKQAIRDISAPTNGLLVNCRSNGYIYTFTSANSHADDDDLYLHPSDTTTGRWVKYGVVSTGGAVVPLRYKVELSKADGAAPVVVNTFENTIGNIVWTMGTGGNNNCKGTLTNAFPSGKTFINMAPNYVVDDGGNRYSLFPNQKSVNEVDIEMVITVSDNGYSNAGWYSNVFLTIEVYP